MRIISLNYYDQSCKWRLESTSFKRLTLLVGASGVGKTQILNSILSLKNISRGISINGVKWKIRFSTFDQKDIYLWKGEFENRPVRVEKMWPDALLKEDENKEPPKIISEKIYLNDSLIVDRDQDRIIFKDEKTVKLPQEQSVIHLLKEEDHISDVHRSFQKILLHHQPEFGPFFPAATPVSPDKHQNIEEIQESDESPRTKLYLASLNAKDVFERIRQRFTDMFPFVEDLKTEPMSEPFFMRGVPSVQIRERGVDKWIKEGQISSGMHRTLLHISELYLCTKGTVILVDEFENSLGINCIDELTNVLLAHERELQFIITSHHPYVINNISSSNWKLITRKAGVVTARDAGDFNLGKSRHEAFTRLINLDEYSEGIEA